MAAQALCVCGFYEETIFDLKDRFLIETSFAALIPVDEIRALSFIVGTLSKHICRKNVDLLKSRKATRTKLQGIDANIEQRCISKRDRAGPIEEMPPLPDLHNHEGDVEHECMLLARLTSATKKYKHTPLHHAQRKQLKRRIPCPILR